MTTLDIKPCLGGKALLLVAHGHRRPVDMGRGQRAFLKAYKAANTRRVLFDPRKAFYDASIETYLTQGLMVLTTLPPTRFAVLKANHLQGLIALVQEMINSSTPHKLRTFNTLKEAERWLSEDLIASHTPRAEPRRVPPLDIHYLD
ncbi:hypothetical protein [Woodsholea maritima]|uniref:hypothetical protein n=1 Tax=Woodsholea maritima TaxID=240237 RepID=UPI000372DE0A|nr:hypothetical protein [Woodsholea maritima]